jgi:hypothetical protein
MKPYLTLVVSETQTRVSMFMGEDEILRANLPPLSKVRHRRAATTLLEGLSLWTEARVCVALSVGNLESCFAFNLTDELGVGARSIFYVVEVVEKIGKRAARIRGVAEFPKTQLSLSELPEVSNER